MNASQLIQRAEQLLRISTMVERKEHQDQLLAICEDYVNRAGQEVLTASERDRLSSLQVQIEDRTPHSS
jgi:hypothetical protein